MSERINKHDNRATIRWKLLTGASAAALISSAYCANAADADNPPIWVSIGWQLEHVQDSSEVYNPVSILNQLEGAGFSSPLSLERPAPFSSGAEASLTFQPEGTDWVFSAAVRYGRSHNDRSSSEKTTPTSVKAWSYYQSYVRRGVLHRIHHYRSYVALAHRYSDASAQNSENHLIVDFQAGKDVGLGMFGHEGKSLLSAGVRFAHLRSSITDTIKGDPDFTWVTLSGSPHPYYDQKWHDLSASAHGFREFRGLGPSISWNASSPVAGNAQNGEISLDWGMNAALLFGRQKTRIHRQTTSTYHTCYNGIECYNSSAYHYPANSVDRIRNVVVPNLGGFAGLSYRFQDVKVSAGYRADFFFNAIDGGFDTRKSENRSFNGPFLNVSVGIGD